MFPYGAFLLPGELTMTSLIDTNSIPAAFVPDALGQYKTHLAVTEDDILQAAKCILAKRLMKGDVIGSPQKTKCFFVTQLAQLEHEVFCVAFLTSQHRVIACEQMFRGSINSSRVYPREVVKRVLVLNAATVIFAHNHPSGDVTPSMEDKVLTKTLSKALSLINVNVLDHIIVAENRSISFAELGLL
jgi:DNA repair protein RadC